MTGWWAGSRPKTLTISATMYSTAEWEEAANQWGSACPKGCSRGAAAAPAVFRAYRGTLQSCTVHQVKAWCRAARLETAGLVKGLLLCCIATRDCPLPALCPVLAAGGSAALQCGAASGVKLQAMTFPSALSGQVQESWAQERQVNEQASSILFSM